MIFHVLIKGIHSLTFKTDNTNVENVDEFNFLGLTLDSNLNLKKHRERISSKCAKIIGILNRLKYVLPLEKKWLYNSVVLSHIKYCIIAWGYKGNILMKIQKKTFRIITLSGYCSHTEPLFKHLNLLKIEDQSQLQELKCYFKYIHRNLPVYLLN